MRRDRSSSPHTHLCSPHTLDGSLELLAAWLQEEHGKRIWSCRRDLKTHERAISIKMIKEPPPCPQPEEHSGNSTPGVSGEENGPVWRVEEG